MVAVVYAAVILMNLVMAYRKKNSRIIVFVSSVLIMLLMCGYRRPFHGDLDNYYYMFIGEMDNTVGMNAIFHLFRKIGFDFYATHYILLVLFWCVCLYVVVQLCNNWHFPIALMSAYYIIISADQIKNHTACIFLLVAILCLFRKKKIVAIIMLSLATTVHYSFAIYFLIILIPRKRASVVMKCCIGAALIYFFMAVLRIDSIVVDGILGIVDVVLPSDTLASIKLTEYISTRTNFGFLLCVIFQLINYWTLIYSKRILTQKSDIAGADIADYALRLNEIGFIVFPLFVYNMQWYRIIRDILLLNYCVYGNTYAVMKHNGIMRWKYLIVVVGGLIIWLVGDLCLKTTPDLVIIPFFTNNKFL